MISPVEPNKNIGNLALILGIIFFILIISSYIFNFHKNPISDNPDNWGVMGDFVGGIVNPILGLVTIWLLTVSLRQNNIMLKQAQAELNLALQQLKHNQDIQSSTEKALREQLLLSQSFRDLEGTIALNSHWQQKYNAVMQTARDETDHAIQIKCSKEEVEKIRSEFREPAQAFLKKAFELDHIIQQETDRLLQKYPPPNNTNDE